MHQASGVKRHPDPANLIIGVIASDQALLSQVRDALEPRFGRIDEQSDVVPFDFTDYYEPEMGKLLVRQWFSLAPLCSLDRLAEIKLATNELEDRWRRPDRTRQVNLDPGFLALHNLILATTKNYAHRIYLGNGIFAETTLLYRQGRYEALDWTYPDYQAAFAREFLTRVRAGYLVKLSALLEIAAN
jgi:hypothetical protein